MLMCPLTGGRPSGEQALVAPMVGSVSRKQQAKEYALSIYVGELHAQPVGHPDSRALVRFTRGPGFDSRSGRVIFPHIHRINFSSGLNPDLAYQWDTKHKTKLISLGILKTNPFFQLVQDYSGKPHCPGSLIPSHQIPYTPSPCSLSS